jgi:hypothetical protein
MARLGYSGGWAGIAEVQAEHRVDANGTAVRQ